MKTLLVAAFAATLLQADTIDLNITGMHPTTGETFSGSGSITIPDGLMTAGIGDVQDFSFQITDQNMPGVGYPSGYVATFDVDKSNLTAFQANFDSSGNILDFTLDSAGDGYTTLLEINSLDPIEGPNAVIQDSYYVDADPYIASASAPEPAVLGMFGAALLLWFATKLRKNQPKDDLREMLVGFRRNGAE